MSRSAKERRGFQLVVVGGVSAGVAVIGAVLAIVGVIGAGLPVISAIVAIVCVVLFRRLAS